MGCLLFCVDVTDGEQQCCVLQVISGDIDGIIHTPAARGSGVGSFRSFRFHKRAVFCTHITSYTFLPRQKKYSLVIHFCE